MRLLFFLLFCFPAFGFSQTASFTVFSDSAPFYLYVNEIQQNATAHTHIRIEGITQPYINIKLVFSDTGIGIINKKNISLVDADNQLMDASYKLKSDKDNKIRLQFYGSSPAGRSVIDSLAMKMQWKEISSKEPEKKEENTFITKSDKANSTTSSVTSSIPSSITKKEVIASTNVIQKPITALPVKKCTGWPIVKEEFDKVKETVIAAKTEEAKLKAAKSLTGSNCLLASQVMELVALFPSEKVKMDFIRFAYAFTIDRQNYGKLKSLLKESQHQADLEELLKLH